MFSTALIRELISDRCQSLIFHRIYSIGLSMSGILCFNQLCIIELEPSKHLTGFVIILHYLNQSFGSIKISRNEGLFASCDSQLARSNTSSKVRGLD